MQRTCQNSLSGKNIPGRIIYVFDNEAIYLWFYGDEEWEE